MNVTFGTLVLAALVALFSLQVVATPVTSSGLSSGGAFTPDGLHPGLHGSGLALAGTNKRRPIPIPFGDVSINASILCFPHLGSSLQLGLTPKPLSSKEDFLFGSSEYRLHFTSKNTDIRKN